MNKEFHKPFIKGMIVVAFATLVAMISTKYVLEIYNTPQKSHEYSSQKSQEQVYSSVGE